MSQPSTTPTRPPLEFLIHDLTEPTSTDPTDIFSSSLSTIFGDARNQHGEPGSTVLYTPSDASFLARTGGGVEVGPLRELLGNAEIVGGGERGVKLVLADPGKEENRFFAHFLWNAGIQAAEMLISKEFDVHNHKVLELGAGAATPSIVACLAGAESVLVSDYPSPAILAAIKTNTRTNLPETLQPRVRIEGHMWGTSPTWLDGSFSRVLVADCMWLAGEHGNLVSSIRRALSSDGICLAIAGFHTGRAKVAEFLEVCVGGGLRVESVEERDVEGGVREWVVDRGREDPVERKRWLTIARLRKAGKGEGR